jgi:hypothetical protein
MSLVLTPAAGELVVLRLPDGRRATIETKRRGKRPRLVLDFPPDVAIAREKPADKEPAQ